MKTLEAGNGTLSPNGVHTPLQSPVTPTQVQLQGCAEKLVLMRQVPLECDINIAVNGSLEAKVAKPKHPFTAILISRSRGTCLILVRDVPPGLMGNPSAAMGK